MRYNNYHKHSHVSNIFSPDCNVKAEDYCKRAVELGHTAYFTTEHGSFGDIFEAKTLCDKYSLKCIAGIEGYIVPDNKQKDRSNYHIVIIPKTNTARRKMNYLSSMANIEGYFYKPRFSTQDLLSLDKDDVYITTACMAGILRDNTSIQDIFLPLFNHFKDNLFLEVQNHNNDLQREINQKAIAFAEEFGLRLIAANDSHYIDGSGKQERIELLKGKDINYGDEDDFMLDYPDYDTLFKRFQTQGVLTDEQIKSAIESTLVFDSCEEIDLDHSIKMPTIYPDLSLPERIEVLKKEINQRFANIKREEGIQGEELTKYLDGIRYEMKIIEDTNEEIHTADYFLFNERLVNLAVNKYGGVLTRGGRGSCGSFYINRILGMTQLDRFRINLPIFPDRFASTARLLENRSLPDIDFNVKEQGPFINAARELLGEHGCYPMIAHGTMQLGEAFRNVCRSKGFPYSEYNEIAKNIELYEDDPKWRNVIEEAKKYVGTIVSASVHPCAFTLSDKNILYEYGVVKVGETFCVMVTSSEADEYKLLKDDFLIVTVWKLIDETFKSIGIPIIPARELLEKIKDDKAVWDLFAKGLTCTLNQVDSDNGMRQAKQYGISSFEDGAFIAAAIRPSFDSWREDFLNRKPYTTGSKDLDDVLSMTHHYILFQENLMQYFDWLGVSPAESIGLIKKISKKKIKPEDFERLEVRLRENWIKNTGSEDMFAETWHMIQSCIAYGFCSAHAAATSLDMCYGAYLKAHYPYEYYTVCFDNYSGDIVRTRKLKNELKYFGITLKGVSFGRSRANHSFNKEEKAIYKGVGAIKYMNDTVAEQLYALKDELICDFVDLLYLMDERTIINTRQRSILIKIGYFDKFGERAKLLDLADKFDLIKYKTKMSFKSAAKTGIPEGIFQKAAGQIKYPRIDEVDIIGYIKDIGIIDIEGELEDCLKKTVTEDTPIEKKYSQAKFLKKYSLSEDELKKYATKTVDGMYIGFSDQNVLREYFKTSDVPAMTLEEIIKIQEEAIGYIEYENPNLDKRYVAVMGYDDKYTPKFKAYCLATGDTCDMQIHKRKGRWDREVKTDIKDVPIKNGDILFMNKCTKKVRQRKTENGYENVPGEFVWWLNDYRKAGNIKVNA